MLVAEATQLTLFSCEEQIEFQHAQSKGFIVVGRMKNSEFRQFSIPARQLKKRIKSMVDKWAGDADVWVSQNSFYKKETRKVEDIGELLHAFADIDCYKLGLTAKQTYWLLSKDYFGRSIPYPNLVIYSGQGLQLIWRLVPEGRFSLPVWQVVSDYLYQVLKELGADPAATDASRILRVVGTTNTKNNETVTAEVLHEQYISLTDFIREYILPNTPEPKPKRNTTKPWKPLTEAQKIKHILKPYTLDHKRMNDMAKLVELRTDIAPDSGKEREQTWGREKLLFLYRYFSCRFLKDPELALKQTLELNRKFKHPLSDKQVIKATRSAEKMFMLQVEEELAIKEAEEAGITLRTKSDELRAKGFPGLGYYYKTATLIEELDITESEMEHLEVTISPVVKEARRRSKRQTIGRVDRRGGQAPCLTRQEYLFECEEAIKDKVTQAQELKAAGMKVADIARQLGVSRPTIYGYLQK